MSAPSPTLVERATELAAVEAALDRATGGEGGVVYVEGAPGLGKTTVLRAATSAARERGFATMTTRGLELETDLALGAADRLVASITDPALEPVVVDYQDARRAAPGTLDPEYGVAHRLNSAISAAAVDAPVLLCVDDAQWLDAASLRLVHFVASRAEGQQVLVLLASRPTGNGTSPLLAALAAPPAVLLPVAPLSAAGVAAVITEIASEETTTELVEACHHATGGNPFLLVELVTGLAADGVGLAGAGADAVAATVPESILRSLLLRLGGLSSAARAVADAVAVLGDGSPVHHLTRLAAVPSDAALAAGSELTGAGIFDPLRPLSYAHPLIATAVRQDLDRHRRARAHADAVAVLTADGAGPEVLAPHLLHTLPAGDATVVDTLVAAAGIALLRGGATSATHFLERALEEPPAATERGTLLADLGAAELAAGNPVSAVEHLAEGLGLATDPEQLTRRAIDLAGATMLVGGVGAAHAVLVDAIGRLPEDATELRRELTAQEIQICLFDALDAERYRGAWERLATLPSPAPDTAAGRAILAMQACREAFYGGTSATAMALVTEALEGGRLARDAAVDALAFGYGMFTAIEAGAVDLADEEIARARADARRRGALRTIAVLEVSQVIADDRRGVPLRVAETIAVARMAANAEPASPLLYVFGGFLDAVEAAVRAEQGAADDADQLAPSYDVTDGNALRMVPWRIRCDLALGRYDAAARGIAVVQRNQQSIGIDWDPSSPWRAWQAAVDAAAGRHEAAREVAEDELARARHWGTPHAIGVALRARGRAERGQAAIPWLTDAADAFDAAGHLIEGARARVDLGSTLLRDGRRTAARGPLSDGLDRAVRAGATGLADRAREELRRAGAKPRRDHATGVESLTASERRVASMAAGGLTNREIAQALFVSAKTVEGHLRQVYGKLGIAGRGDLTRHLP